MKPIISSIAVLLALIVVDAAASPSCMTKSEARAAYPRAHLYWSGSNRCWSDQAGRSQARRYRARPVRDDVVDDPKPLPPAPAPVTVPEPEPRMKTAEAVATATVGRDEERWRKHDEMRIALEAMAAKIMPPPRVYTGRIEPEPLPPEEVSQPMQWARFAGALVVFASISVGGVMLSRRYLPNLMVGS